MIINVYDSRYSGDNRLKDSSRPSESLAIISMNQAIKNYTSVTRTAL